MGEEIGRKGRWGTKWEETDVGEEMGVERRLWTKSIGDLVAMMF